MEFKTTFTKPRRPRQAGFTLVEILIAAALSGMLLAVCLSLALFTSRSIASVTDSVDLNARTRHAIDRMGKKLRQTSSLESFSPTSVTVTFDGQPLTYTYDARLKTLVEDEAGKKTTLLEDCDQLAFALYKRSPLSNSFNQYPVLAATNEAKLIQMSWRCSRSLVGKKSGSAELASARFVFRAK